MTFGPASKSPNAGAWYAIDRQYNTTEVVLCPEQQKEKLIKTGGVWYFNVMDINDPVAVSDRYAKARDLFKKARSTWTPIPRPRRSRYAPSSTIPRKTR